MMKKYGKTKFSANCVRVLFEIGHEAILRNKKTQQGFTHDWELFVRGADNTDIHFFVDKVIFNLHDSFANPRRVLKEPPYVVRESGYAGFSLPIDIYLRNKEEPHKIRFKYYLELQQSGPPLSHVKREEYVFSNPSEDFRRKLIKGGGVGVGGGTMDSSVPSIGNHSNQALGTNSLDDKIPTGSTAASKTKLSSTQDYLSSSKKSKSVKDNMVKIEEPLNLNDPFSIFGQPIKTSKTQLNQKLNPPKLSSLEKVVPSEKHQQDHVLKLAKHSSSKKEKKDKDAEKDKERDKEKEHDKEKSYKMKKFESTVKEKFGKEDKSKTNLNSNINNANINNNSNSNSNNNSTSSNNVKVVKDDSKKNSSSFSADKKPKRRSPSPTEKPEKESVKVEKKEKSEKRHKDKKEKSKDKHKNSGSSERKESSSITISKDDKAESKPNEINKQKEEKKNSSKHLEEKEFSRNTGSNEKDNSIDSSLMYGMGAATNDCIVNNSTTNVNNDNTINNNGSTSGIVNVNCVDNNETTVAMDYHSTSTVPIATADMDNNSLSVAVIDTKKDSSGSKHKHHKHKKEKKSKRNKEEKKNKNKEESTVTPASTQVIRKEKLPSSSPELTKLVHQHNNNNINNSNNVVLVKTENAVANTVGSPSMKLTKPLHQLFNELSDDKSDTELSVSDEESSVALKQRQQQPPTLTTASTPSLIAPVRLQPEKSPATPESPVPVITPSSVPAPVSVPPSAVAMTDQSPENYHNNRKRNRRNSIDRADAKRHKKKNKSGTKLQSNELPSPVPSTNSSSVIDMELYKDDESATNANSLMTSHHHHHNQTETAIMLEERNHSNNNTNSSTASNSRHSSSAIMNHNPEMSKFTDEYISKLKELQHKIMTTNSNQELQRIVQIIAETGRYEITAKTFDFDLCLLDESTVHRLAEITS